jgi:hypothetical protein
MALAREEFFAALAACGMPEIPRDFSVASVAQLIPLKTLLEIDNFIRLCDRVTIRATWQRVVTGSAPEIARFPRSEVCFFTAWDFHLSLEQGWQLIECNDNGSGFLFAALINHRFYELSDLRQNRSVEEPASMVAFTEHLLTMIERETREFFGSLPDGLYFVLNTSDTQHARCAWSSCAIGAPNSTMIPSPVYWLTVPSKR